jgi:uncharacterized Fe-S cluster protein YjdI
MSKKYTNGEITINWQPKLCKHAAVCVKTLPKVYNPKGSPWLTIDNATTAELKSQVNKCPTGALTYNENKNDE